MKGGWGHDLSIAFGSNEQRDWAVARTVRDAIGQADGWVAPPEGPGLGVDVDETVVRHYRFREDALGR